VTPAIPSTVSIAADGRGVRRRVGLVALQFTSATIGRLPGRRDPHGGTARRRSIENERSSWPCHLDQNHAHGSATRTARPRGVGERLDVRRNDSVGLDRAFPRAAHRHSVAIANARSHPYGHSTGDRGCRRAASGERDSQRRKAESHRARRRARAITRALLTRRQLRR
jgi:hypothetical protein